MTAPTPSDENAPIDTDPVKLDGWLKKLAPRDELRRRFGHDPSRFAEFQKAYLAELAENPSAQPLRNAACQQTVTLLFAAHDRKHNNAVVLKKFLEGKRNRTTTTRTKVNAC